MDIDDLFKKFVDSIAKKESPETEWPVVGQLRPEDILRYKTYRSDVAALRGQAEVLVAKLRALEAEREVKTAELWEEYYRTYSLPRDLSYAITDDNLIRKRPKNARCFSEGPVRLCLCGKCGDR